MVLLLAAFGLADSSHRDSQESSWCSPLQWKRAICGW
jgi:hypothetical protein